METILITGGTGLIGRQLCEKLKEKGYVVTILSRTSKKDGTYPTYAWNLDKKEIDKESLKLADCIIHLAGANLGEKMWTSKRKKLIIDSRVQTGQLIFEKTKEINNKVKVLISASAVGYYGTITSDKIFSETDKPSNDFLGDVCRQWEQSIDKFEELGLRVVKIRTGVVLTKQDGALSKMSRPVKVGLGSAIGNGKQYIPWIHIDDLCDIYIKAIEDIQMNGVYNAVAPDYKTNSDFNQIMAHILHRPLWIPNIPALVIKLIFGNMSEILLKGSRVSSEKIIKAGYQFKFPDLESALVDLLRKNTK
jgi:uncharacterized protein (TIGR01777 family)